MSVLLSLSQIIKADLIFDPDTTYATYEVLPNEKIHFGRIWNADADPKKGQEGDGSAPVSKIMERAIKENLSVTSTVAWNSKSHIFHLKMGMIPDDFPYSYIARKYGKEGYFAIKAFEDSVPNAEEIKHLKAILKGEENRSEITDAEVLERKAFFLELLEKQYSYLKDHFIPAFLKFLRSGKGSTKVLDSRDLGSMNMHLSEKGRKVWQHAIEDEIPFPPFRKFEHLVPFLSDAQKTELSEVLN